MAVFRYSFKQAATVAAVAGAIATAMGSAPSDAQAPQVKREAVKVAPKTAPTPQIRQVAPRPASRPAAQSQSRPTATPTVRREVQKIVRSQPSTSVPSVTKVDRPTPSPTIKKVIPATPASTTKVTSPATKVTVPKVTKIDPAQKTTPGVPSKIVTPTVPGKVLQPTLPAPGTKIGQPTIPGKIVQPTLPLPGTKIGQPTIPGKIGQPTLPGGVVPLPGSKTLPLPGKITAPLPSTGPKTIPWQGKLPIPAPGLTKVLPFKPVKPGVNLTLLPKLPPIPPKRWTGPPFGTIPPRLTWHPWAGKRVFPYFFVGLIAATAIAVPARAYWSPPPPSCYAGGSAVYYYPGTRTCFDFSVAQPEDPFECHGRVFRWKPERYRTVETLIAETADTSEVAEGWVEKEPSRKVLVTAGMQRASVRAQTVAAVPMEKLDCSTCLAALGPTEGNHGLATVSLVNNCEHDVTVAGGLAKVDAPAGTEPVCEFVGDIPTGGEVAACTKPAEDFADAQLFLNTVAPAAGTAKAAPACRIPEQSASAQ
jgi:hypothetical protein